jgi:multidrug efflux pump subunit AcrA (membrane-fusion protein)
VAAAVAAFIAGLIAEPSLARAQTFRDLQRAFAALPLSAGSAAAVGSGQLGKYLFVAGKDNVVEQRIVALGPSDQGLVAITRGVSEGDWVIEGNLQKIGPGTPVKPIPSSN